jgi:hypothetical protein
MALVAVSALIVAVVLFAVVFKLARNRRAAAKISRPPQSPKSGTKTGTPEGGSSKGTGNSGGDEPQGPFGHSGFTLTGARETQTYNMGERNCI